VKRQWLVVSGQWLVLATVAAHAQMMDAPVKVKSYVAYAAESQVVAAGKKSVVEMRFHVMDGYHVNSHRPKGELLVPTALTLDAADGVKAGEVEYPAGTVFSFGADPADKLDVYTGDFTVKLPVVAAVGEHTIAGTLKYQACDNKACYPAKTLTVQILFTAK
jgi:DsbC/DsbD-like thiol-disulfide interchange protein